MTTHSVASYPWLAPRGRLNRRSAATPAAVRRWALILFLALIPMLSAIDHLDLRFDIPGTDSYFSLQPPAGSHGHGGHSHGAAEGDDSLHTHADHCHINAASCGDQPAPSTTGFALLHDSVRLLGATAPLLLVLGAPEAIPAGRNIAPTPPPPR